MKDYYKLCLNINFLFLYISFLLLSNAYENHEITIICFVVCLTFFLSSISFCSTFLLRLFAHKLIIIMFKSSYMLVYDVDIQHIILKEKKK